VQTFGNVDHSGKDGPGERANSFIINPAPAGGVARTYRIPVTQVNRYWGGTHEGYGNNDANVIHDGETWAVSLVWAESGLFSSTPSSTLITLANSGAGIGPNGTFELTVPAGLPEGNFVLGLKKSGGTQWLWSWHFWVTDYNPDSFNRAAITAGRYTYPVPGGQVERYGDIAANGLWATTYAQTVSMDRALGATADYFTTRPVNNARGSLHYQSGRKDPIPSDALAVIPGSAGSSVTVAESVHNPNRFYAVASGDWSNQATAMNYAWRDPATQGNMNDKSIYDPCPPGWKLPFASSATTSTWSDFARGIAGNYTNTQNPARDLAWGYGRGIGTPNTAIYGIRYWPGTTATDPVEGRIWFPATGNRTLTSGGFSSVGGTGYYWSTYPSSTVSGFYLYFTNGTVTPAGNGNRGFGFAARCLSE
jgi:hypothetical protein